MLLFFICGKAPTSAANPQTMLLDHEVNTEHMHINEQNSPVLNNFAVLIV